MILVFSYATDIAVDNQILIQLVLTAALGWMVWVAAEQGLEVEASLKDKGRKVIKIIQNNQTPGVDTSPRPPSSVYFTCNETFCHTSHKRWRLTWQAQTYIYRKFTCLKCETEHLFDINTNLV